MKRSGSHLERVFDPFFSTQPERIGLGRSIARQIVDFHGGPVQVERQAGQGGMFHILLPIRANPCAG
ncbi:MAG: hypothetical protein HYY20_01510 [Candidatus Tectomicrobia bacterium]|uniref:histidine kinase n=1 Tax=Tectimicrobiota bacterium TaxID=2528274 RepID=A0A932CLU5_UNCTE|nr:hypothetical protein [Candidatus Tectomicrobia bacterium]